MWFIVYLYNVLWKKLGIKVGKRCKLIFGFFFWDKSAIMIEDGVCIWFGFLISNSSSGSLTIWTNTQINRDFTCWVQDHITIGKDCLFSYRVSLQSWDHIYTRHWIPGWEWPTKPIIIWDRCFLGCNVTVLKWVTLWNNCVVGANSVVTKSFPAWSIVGWNPAVLLKTLSN